MASWQEEKAERNRQALARLSKRLPRLPTGPFWCTLRVRHRATSDLVECTAANSIVLLDRLGDVHNPDRPKPASVIRGAGTRPTYADARLSLAILIIRFIRYIGCNDPHRSLLNKYFVSIKKLNQCGGPDLCFVIGNAPSSLPATLDR